MQFPDQDPGHLRQPTCYRFPRAGGAIREISAKVIQSWYFCLSPSVKIDRPVTFDSSRR
jgi:hypothetical protein